MINFGIHTTLKRQQYKYIIKSQRMLEFSCAYCNEGKIMMRISNKIGANTFCVYIQLKIAKMLFALDKWVRKFLVTGIRSLGPAFRGWWRVHSTRFATWKGHVGAREAAKGRCQTKGGDVHLACRSFLELALMVYHRQLPLDFATILQKKIWIL